MTALCDTTAWSLVSFCENMQHWQMKNWKSSNTRQDALPEAVSLPHSCLPQAQGAVLRAAGVQLTVRTEANAVDRTKVTLVGFLKHNNKKIRPQILDLLFLMIAKLCWLTYKIT